MRRVRTYKILSTEQKCASMQHVAHLFCIHLSFQGMIVEIAMIWEIGEWHDEWLRYRMIDVEMV